MLQAMNMKSIQDFKKSIQQITRYTRHTRLLMFPNLYDLWKKKNKNVNLFNTLQEGRRRDASVRDKIRFHPNHSVNTYMVRRIKRSDLNLQRRALEDAHPGLSRLDVERELKKKSQGDEIFDRVDRDWEKTAKVCGGSLSLSLSLSLSFFRHVMCHSRLEILHRNHLTEEKMSRSSIQQFLKRDSTKLHPDEIL